jgi:hypothetical protein
LTTEQENGRRQPWSIIRAPGAGDVSDALACHSGIDGDWPGRRVRRRRRRELISRLGAVVVGTPLGSDQYLPDDRQQFCHRYQGAIQRSDEGDTIWVAATVTDFAGAHSIALSDTQGNVYTLLDQVNDGPPGTQSVAHFYAANIVGDSMTPDTITVTWGNDDYKGVLIAEISGTAAAPLAGHARNDQVGLVAGSNNVTAGPIDLSSAHTPALLVALSMNTFGGTSDTGGTGIGGPTAGNGMTQVQMSWNWGANLATLATASVTSAESVSSLFSASGAGSYVTVAAAFH